MNMTAEDFQKFIDVAEQLIPGFSQQVALKMKENDNASLLQREQNLTEDINLLTKKLTEKTNAHNEIVLKAKSLSEEFHKAKAEAACLFKQCQQIQADIDELNEERTAIHKKWIVANPSAQQNKSEIHRPDIREAFKILAVDVYGVNPNLYKDDYKRFDNLVNARCRSTFLFDDSSAWTIDDVCTNVGYFDARLKTEILNWWKFKSRSK